MPDDCGRDNDDGGEGVEKSSGSCPEGSEESCGNCKVFARVGMTFKCSPLSEAQIDYQQRRVSDRAETAALKRLVGYSRTRNGIPALSDRLANIVGLS